MMQQYLAALFSRPVRRCKWEQRVTRDEDYRGLEIWAAYRLLLKTPNYGDRLHYEIPYGRDNVETHPRVAWVNQVNSRYAGNNETTFLGGQGI